MHEFTGASGAKIVINAAPWKDAKELKKALQVETSQSNIPLSFDADASLLISVIMRVDGSEAVDRALWPCLVRCLRNDEKITEATFNDADARKDYYDIVIACVKENLGPLLVSLFSQLSALGITKQAGNIQKPE